MPIITGSFGCTPFFYKMNKIIGFIAYAVYITILIILIVSIVQPLPVIAEAVDEEISFKEGDLVPQFVIDKIIEQHATGTKAYMMSKTVYCESRNYNVQSYIVKNGIREPSYGLSQIHLISHPSITKEQALDVNYAIKWMSDNWENTAWYGYDRLNDHCN